MITILKEKKQTNPCLFIFERTLPLCWALFSSLSLSICTRAHYVNSLTWSLGGAQPFTYFSPNSCNDSRREELLSPLLWWRDSWSKRSCGHSWQNWDSNPGLIPSKLCKLVIDMIFVTVFFTQHYITEVSPCSYIVLLIIILNGYIRFPEPWLCSHFLLWGIHGQGHWLMASELWW